MERLSPELLLLQESERANTFFLKSTNGQLCDWMNLDHIDLFLVVEKTCINKVKHQASSTTVNKSLKSNQGRYTPCSRWTKRLTNLDIKFEHFSDYTYYMEQYRRMKQLRLEERLAKLIKRKGNSENGQIMNASLDNSNLKSSDFASEQVCVYPKHEQQSHRVSGQRYDNAVKPSLPQSGCFAGRKWVYPKDFARACSKNIGVKCGSARTQLKTTEKQVYASPTNMFLQGTGKPLNNYCNKTWTVSRHQTACKSAPTSQQHQSKNSNTDSRNNAKWMKFITQKNSLTCDDLNKLLENHPITQPKSTLQTTTVNQFHGNVKIREKSVGSPPVGHRMEYEQIFKHVFDFYEQNTDTRSHLYINT